MLTKCWLNLVLNQTMILNKLLHLVMYCIGRLSALSVSNMVHFGKIIKTKKYLCLVVAMPMKKILLQVDEDYFYS